jgi:cysteine desulfurase
LAALLGCQEDEVYFTSGGTEANNLAIRGVAEARPERRRLVTSAIEHPATEKPCQWLAKHGQDIQRIQSDAEGRVRLEEAARLIDDTTALVTVMHSNNETGVLQPIAELAELARRHGAVMHTDAAQSLGKVAVRVDDLGVDLLSIAGHKLYAPKGVGALYVRRGTPIAPLVLGAGHERGLRPGTENVASIVALGQACEIAGGTLAQERARQTQLRDQLEQSLRAQVPGLALNGHAQLRLANTLNVRFPRVSGIALLAACPQVAASTGSACHDGGESASAVILALGVDPQDALGSVRLTLGRGTTAADVARAAELLVEAWRKMAA